MFKLSVGEFSELVIEIPGSTSGDSVTFECFDSDGNVIDSGSMEFVRDEVWKVPSPGICPKSVGELTLKSYDSTLDSKRESTFSVIGGTT